MVLRRGFLISATAFALVGCASDKAARPDAPAGTQEAPPAARTYGRTTPPIVCAPDPRNTDLKRRQYCDKRKRRFYFFDPEHKQYFWENGEPKG